MPDSSFPYTSYVREMAGKNRCDMTQLLADADVFERAIEYLASPFKGQGVTKVAALDALGFALGGGVARSLGAGLVLIRKEGKTAWEVETSSFRDYTATEKTFEVASDAIKAGDKVLVVDDWSETGAQLKAAFQLIERLQGTIAGAALFHIEEGIRNDPALSGYALHYLFDY